MNRYDEARAAGRRNYLVKGSGGLDARQNDAYAEEAERLVLARYGFPPAVPHDCDIVDIRHTKKGPHRTCLDIKWTKNPNGFLLVEKRLIDTHASKRFGGPNCTAYILTTGDPFGDDFDIAGWAWGFRVAANPVSKAPSGKSLPLPGYGLYRDDPHFRTNVDLLMASLLYADVVA